MGCYKRFLRKINKAKKHKKRDVTLGSAEPNEKRYEAYSAAANKLRNEGHEIETKVEYDIIDEENETSVEPSINIRRKTWKVIL